MPQALPAIHFLALVAYNQEAVSAAIDVAVNDARAQYGSRVNFTYSLLWNPDYACDTFEGMVANYVSQRFYGSGLRTSNTTLIILATGCSQAEYTVAELAREWNIPIVISTGTGSLLRNKKRYPIMTCFVPTDFTRYPRVFKGLLDWHKWRTVTIICDGATENSDFYMGNVLHGQCRDFALALTTPSSSNQANSSQHYQVHNLLADLGFESHRRAALAEARMHSRIIVIVTFLDNVRLTLVDAYKMGMTTPEYVYISNTIYPFNIFGSGELDWHRNDSRNLEAKLAFQSLLHFTLARPVQSAKLNQVLSSIRTISLTLFNGSGYLTDNDKLFSISTYTTVQVTAQIVSERLHADDPFNGQKLAKSMYNRTFATVDGLCEMNRNGDRDNVYAVLGMTTENGTLEELLLFNARNEKMYPSPNNVSWMRKDKVPTDRPYCGFSGEDERCVKGNNRTINEIIIFSAVTLMVLCVSGSVYHHRRRESIDRGRDFYLKETLYWKEKRVYYIGKRSDSIISRAYNACPSSFNNSDTLL